MGPGYELWADTAKNAVNNFGNISSILNKIDVASICDFPYFKDQQKMDATFTQGDIIPTDWLTGTIWAESKAPIIGTLVPNFFIVYFGQDLPYGNIDDNEVMLQLARMGPG